MAEGDRMPRAVLPHEGHLRARRIQSPRARAPSPSAGRASFPDPHYRVAQLRRRRGAAVAGEPACPGRMYSCLVLLSWTVIGPFRWALVAL
jgi:hypothetical protein